MKTIVIKNWLKFVNRENRDVKFIPTYRDGAYVNVFNYTDECEQFLKENDIEYTIDKKEYFV